MILEFLSQYNTSTNGALTNLGKYYQYGNVVEINGIIIQNKNASVTGGIWSHIYFDKPFTDINTISVTAMQTEPLISQSGTVYVDGIKNITLTGFDYFANTNGNRNVRFIAMGR